jgi:hypothetical protein
MTYDEIRKLGLDICQNFKGDTELKDFDLYLQTKYGIWDYELFFPADQIYDHCEVSKIVNDMLKFKLSLL